MIGAMGEFADVLLSLLKWASQKNTTLSTKAAPKHVKGISAYISVTFGFFGY